MASVERTTHGTYRVRYRDPLGRSRGKTFKRQAQAREFASSVEAAKAHGEYVSPRLSKQPLGLVADQWWSTTKLAPKTTETYESTLRTWVLPYFASMPVAAIDKASVRQFVAWMQDEKAQSARGWSTAGIGTVQKAVKVLRLVLGYAVDQGAVRANAADRVGLSTTQAREMHFLSPDQVDKLAGFVGETWRPLVMFAAYTGLRSGELAGLRVRRLNLDALSVTVAETVGDVGGHLHTGGTKTRQVRTVPIPSLLVEMMRTQVQGKAPDDYVFGVGATPLRHNNFYGRYFKPAAKRLGVPDLRFHDLRHTNAAMLIRLGAHPRAIMERLGHSSITVTLNTYGHLFPELSKELTEALDALGRSADRRHASSTTRPELATGGGP